MNIFDICDSDNDGMLSKDEFNIYNNRTADQVVTEEEWEILISKFT